LKNIRPNRAGRTYQIQMEPASRRILASHVCRRPGRTHHTHISFPPTIHPLACVRPGYWSLPVKAAAADLVRPGGSSGANRAELNLPAEPEGSWAVGAVAIRSPAPTEVKRPCRPTRRPTPRPYRQFRGAHGGAPVFSSRPAKRAHHQSTTTAAPRRASLAWPGLTHLPARAGPPLPLSLGSGSGSAAWLWLGAVASPNSPGARGRPCMNELNLTRRSRTGAKGRIVDDASAFFGFEIICPAQRAAGPPAS